MGSAASPSLQDFSLINSQLDAIVRDREVLTRGHAFYYLALRLTLDVPDDDIDEIITDSSYLSSKKAVAGHDRGIDALYVDDSKDIAEVHIYNCKFTNEFRKTVNHFPSSEIDKIISSIDAMMSQNEEHFKNVNPILKSKISDVWDIFTKTNPKFNIYICANMYNGFEPEERRRFESGLAKYSGISVHYVLMQDFVECITHGDRIKVNCKIKAIDKHLFEKSGGDIKALIVDVEARDLIRIVIDDESIRNNPDLQDYSEIKNHKILEDAFADNIRIYLKQRSRINRNIKETALSDDGHRFFYFNNGITLTCDRLEYPNVRRAPIIEIENLQVVNGGQTIHALYDAFCENSEQFDDIEILCRIYETKNKELAALISENTNSQNPVNIRDIKSNDFVQKILEKELLSHNYYYERKKNQYSDKPKSRRIDAEKAGQALLALQHSLPDAAKDKRRLVYSDYYEKIFNDSITADDIIIANSLYAYVEEQKLEIKSKIIDDQDEYLRSSFILHASYAILYVLSKISNLKGIPLKPSYISEIVSFYDNAVKVVRNCVDKEKNLQKDKYTHRMYFKSPKLREHIDLRIHKLGLVVGS